MVAHGAQKSIAAHTTAFARLDEVRERVHDVYMRRHILLLMLAAILSGCGDSAAQQAADSRLERAVRSAMCATDREALGHALADVAMAGADIAEDVREDTVWNAAEQVTPQDCAK